MNKLLLILFCGFFFYSCDCYQEAVGIVFDSETKQPIDNVALGKYEKVDTTNSYSRRTFTDDKGQFNYSSVGGGLGSCDFDLYFSKDGYESLKVSFQQTSATDTIYLKKRR